MKTRITELFGIQYPIIMGGMHNVTDATLAAAVSEAGGLGVLPAATYPTRESLTQEIRRAKSLTDKPIAVNISMLPSLAVGELTEMFVDVVVNEGIGIVETSGRSPKEIVPKLKDNGVVIMHKVVEAKHGIRALEDGADAIALVGYEAAGHPGLNEVGTFVNIQDALAKIDAPVVAAGGICSGKGLLAALAMGAEGVLMGTAFMLVHEAKINERIKQWMIDARVTDTMITQRSIRNPVRCMNNGYAHMVLGYEYRGANIEALLPLIRGELGKKALKEGTFDAQITMGQCVGLLNARMSCKEFIDGIMSEAQDEIRRVNLVFSE